MSTGTSAGPTGAGAGPSRSTSASATISTARNNSSFERVEGALYQDKNIAILPKSDPRGVELIHVVGYMDPIMANENENVNVNVIQKITNTGLKSSGRLLSNAGIPVPKNYNEDVNDESIHAMSRRKYLKYDPGSLSRIFFRPPSTAPFKLEDDTFVPAGNWRDFLGHPREHRLFFGGESYTDSMENTSEEAAIAQGLITIRVHPDYTYVFYEKMKDIQNRNRETGIPRPPQKTENTQRRYRESRIKLSDYLNSLQATPGKVENGYEVIATTDIIPSTYFERIIRKGDTSNDTREEPEDTRIKREGALLEDRRFAQGDAMKKEVYQLLEPLMNRATRIAKAAGELRKQVDSKIKTAGTKQARIQEALRTLDDLGSLSLQDAFAEAKSIVNPRGGPRRELHPIQKEWFTYLLENNIFRDLKFAQTVRKSAVDELRRLGVSSGGKRKTYRISRKKSRKTRISRK